jgi:hypothetical protein
MLVCAYVDWNADTDQEYKEIKEFLERELKWEFKFKPNMRPQDMLQQPADVYVLDYGGVQGGYGDGGYSFFQNEVIKLVEERPNLLVLLWTAFTGFGYFEVAKRERPDLAQAPNVIFCDGNVKFGKTSRYDKKWQRAAQAWVGGKPVKPKTRDLVYEAIPSSLHGATRAEIIALFPKLSPSTIRKHIRALEKEGKIDETCVGRFSRG